MSSTPVFTSRLFDTAAEENMKKSSHCADGYSTYSYQKCSKHIGKLFAMLVTRTLFGIVLFAASAGFVHAAQHALLIGVADYPNLPRRLWLKGPVNDVALVRNALLEKGFSSEQIQALVSRGGTTAEPTRVNIVAAFERLRKTVKPGDRVFFYLAGHGSKQPQPKLHPGQAVEADGFDEVFLPADVRQWTGAALADGKQTIPNALLDDEIGEWIDSLVDAGAIVWGVFDTCHASGMARSDRSDRSARWRAISPADLGLPVKGAPVSLATSSLKKNGLTVSRNLTAGRQDGRNLAFAARSHELAGEEWLPRGAPMSQARMQGVFTWHLVQALRALPSSSISTPALTHAVNAAYQREGRASPVPQWLGDVWR